MNGSIIVTRNTQTNPGMTMKLVAIRRDIGTYSDGVKLEREILAADATLSAYRMPTSAVNEWLVGNGFDPTKCELSM